MTQAQQTEKAYPDLSSLKRELGRTQRERNKANLDQDQAKLERNQANLERDQAVIEKDQARRELDMLKAEHQYEQRVRENAANCEQLKSELERIQRRQRELHMQKGARPKERTVAGSRPESRMEVDDAPRSKGRFNLDRAAQEHMNEGLEVWIPTESTSSLHGLETQPIRPLIDVALPGYTPSSTPSGSQVSGSSSRLKELNERLQLRNRESQARVELPPTWREQPIRSVVISSYKKYTEGRYHRHNRIDWSTAQRVRRDCFHDCLNLGERNLWMSFLVVENMDESDQFILGRDFIRIFDITIDLNNAMFKISNPDRRYAIKPLNLIIANENKAAVFLSRRVRLKANEAAILSLRMKNYNELSDNKQVCLGPNPNSQSAAVLGSSFSITKSGLCVSVLLNTGICFTGISWDMLYPLKLDMK